ncbi:MAG TPA: tripartite tricarboxylate transporter substrate binding protein [Burkholderiales bacterium]|nr:tripartite tricarboxylate transporter substrate binding protein [Burkholderiales bacterium]
MIHRRRFIGLAAASLLAPAFTVRRALAQGPAQVWPARPVRIVVGFSGGPEVSARILASPLTALWGQQAIVETKMGASGNIAAETVARSAPDGHTLLLAGTPLAVSRFLYPSLAFDPVADFAPVSLVSRQPNVMIVPNTSPARSIAEFVAHAKANPGKITYGSPGRGTTVHLCGELFKRKTGVQMTHVPYSAPSTIMSDLIAGRIDAVFPTFALALPLITAGRVRALAVAWPGRIRVAPELPTFREAGVPGFDDVSLWFGLFVPAGTPPAIVERIHSDTAAALADPTVKLRFEQAGATPAASTPPELARHFKAEMDRWGPVIKEAKITIND